MPEKVLIVDDEPVIREMLKDVLEEAGYGAEVAPCAEEALKIIPHYKPDILVSDIWMPGMDGHAFCRAARYMSDASILMISGVPSEISLLQNQGDANDFLIKPFNIENFVERIEFLLEKRRVASNHPSESGKPGLVAASGEPKLSRPRININDIVSHPLLWIVIALTWVTIILASR